jgi:hypothetical protein
MSKNTAATLKIATSVKPALYRLVTANGLEIDKDSRLVEVKTKLLIVSTPSGHEEELTFNIVPITYQIILRKP